MACFWGTLWAISCRDHTEGVGPLPGKEGGRPKVLCAAAMQAGYPVTPDLDPGEIKQDQVGSIPSETPEQEALVNSGGLRGCGLREKGGKTRALVQYDNQDEGCRWGKDNKSQPLALVMTSVPQGY